jgi:hypothetical protein
MRLFRLAQAAWQAESLYLRRTSRGYAVQAGYGAAAAAFALLLLVMLHIAAFAALVPATGPVWAALIVALGDLVLAGILGSLARNPPKDPVAEEALRIRQAATAQLSDTAVKAAALAPLLRSQSAKKGLIGAAVTAAVVGFIARR